MLASQVFFLGIRCLPDVYLRLPARSRQAKHAGRRGIIRILLIFKGAHELKVRQIDYNIIFPSYRQEGVGNLFQLWQFHDVVLVNEHIEKRLALECKCWYKLIFQIFRNVSGQKEQYKSKIQHHDFGGGCSI